MNDPVIDVEPHQELAPAIDVAPPPAQTKPTQAVQPPAMSQPFPAAPAQPRAPLALLERAQVYANRALAETVYQVRRLGTPAIAGIAAVVMAATVFIANNLPQGAAVAALKGQLVQLAPAAKGASMAVPGSAVLASLPPRGDAPDVVAKILEEARAAGVELPRGQYEYVPARDGVAARYSMTFPVRTSYSKLREFMDRTLVALPAVAVEGLRIERKNVGDDSVDAELKLAAYVQGEP